MKLRELAERLACRLEGDGEVEIVRVAGIEDAGPGDLTFVANPKYLPALATTRASAVLLGDDAPTPSMPVLRTPDPYLGFARAVGLFAPEWKPRPGVHAMAAVPRDATIGDGASIGAFVAVGEAATIGDRTIVFPNVTIGAGARIGADCVIHSNVAIRERVTIGDRVVLQNGVVVGVGGHLTIGRGVVAVGQSGITNSVDPGTMVAGYPAIEAREWRRAAAIYRRLPELKKRLEELEAKLAALQGSKDSE